MTTDQTDDLSYTNLSRKLTAQQLAGIRDALCPGYEAPPVSPTLCRSVEKQIASIRRLSEVQPSPGARRGALLAAALGEGAGGKLDMGAARRAAVEAMEKISSGAHSKEGRHVWKAWEEEELGRLVEDAGYRLEVLGDGALDYQKLGLHFQRSESAVRKKCWSMTMKRQAVNVKKEEGEEEEEEEGTAKAASRAAAEEETFQDTKKTKASQQQKRKWTDEENERMQQFVQSEAYRVERGVQDGGSKAVKWEVLAKQFKHCKAGQAQKKFQALKGMLGANGGVVKERKQNRRHHQKKVAYKWMIVTVMRTFDQMKGTAPDIFEAIEGHPDFRLELDMSIAPGTQQVPRWRTQVRKTLSAEKIFVNTGVKVNKETLWDLDINAVADLIADNPKQRIGDLDVLPATGGGG